jgi:hypothetical protein
VRGRIKKRNAEKRSMCAVVAAKSSLFAGPVPVGFRFVMTAWRRTCGVLPAVG